MPVDPTLLPPCRASSLPTGVHVLWTSPEIAHCTLRSPRTELPCLIRTRQSAAFELPAATRLLESNEEVVVDLWSDRELHIGEFKTPLTRGLLRSNWDVMEADGDSESGDPVAIGVERLIGYHIERINEIVFPSGRRGRKHPGRAEGLTIAPWHSSRQIYWETDDEDGPLRLIVRIARECTETLRSICLSPRKALRRVRQKERFNRVQQMDDACIRWFIRQPGRTIVQKAGPRREVMCVVRLESADTPENRVVRDFVERAIKECTSYLKSHGHRMGSTRVKDVRGFRAHLIGWMRQSELREVPCPVGVPSANYVLQFDERYSLIWFWYDRLRRQQSGAEDAWRWRRRMLVEYCRLAVAERLSRMEVEATLALQLFLKTDADRGCFLDAHTELGPWRSQFADQSEFVYLLTSDEFSRAEEAGLLPHEADLGGADLLIVRVRPFERVVKAAMAIYIEYTLDPDDHNRLQQAAETLAGGFDDAGLPSNWSIAVFCGDPQLMETDCRVSFSSTTTQRLIGTVVLPLNPNAESIVFDPLLFRGGISRAPASGRA